MNTPGRDLVGEMKTDVGAKTKRTCHSTVKILIDTMTVSWSEVVPPV